MSEAQSLFEIAENAHIKPVSVQAIGNGYRKELRIVDVISQNSLSFQAKDLLHLSDDEIYELSRRLRKLFTRIASQNNTKVGRNVMALFKRDEDNCLVHEISHFKVLKELTPEAIDGATINFLPLYDGDRLELSTSVMYDHPSKPYSPHERARLVLAPNRPSDQDYFDLDQHISTYGLGNDRDAIVSIIESKPKSSGKEKLLKHIASI